MNSSDKFRLLPIEEVVANRPVFGLMVSPIKNVLKRIVKGSIVKLQVEAVGQAKKAPEEIWVIIQEAKNGHYRGVVNTRTNRAQFHGLQLDSPIQFRARHIIDVLTQK